MSLATLCTGCMMMTRECVQQQTLIHTAHHPGHEARNMLNDDITVIRSINYRDCPSADFRMGRPFPSLDTKSCTCGEMSWVAVDGSLVPRPSHVFQRCKATVNCYPTHLATRAALRVKRGKWSSHPKICNVEKHAGKAWVRG